MAPEYLESMGTVLFDSIFESMGTVLFDSIFESAGTVLGDTFFGTPFAGVILTGIRQMLMQFRVIPQEALYTFKG